MNVSTYAIKTGGLTTIARGTFDDWKETLELLAAEGIDIELRAFSDYSGDAIGSDEILYYHHDSNTCPVSCPVWLF